MTKLAINAALAACLSLLAVPAAAEDFSVQVPYGDLDVASATGAKALAQRVESACERPDIRNLRAVEAWQQCKDETRTSAMEQLNSKGVAFDTGAFLGV